MMTSTETDSTSDDSFSASTSDSESVDIEKNKKSKNFQKKKSTSEELDPTSSLNQHCICDACSRYFKRKVCLYLHLTKNRCKGIKAPRRNPPTKNISKVIKTKGQNLPTKASHRAVCHWCNMEFKNKGNLAHHAKFMHGEISENVKRMMMDGTIFTCEICKDRMFRQKCDLTYHIRREHMNLKAQIPNAEMKKVNEVWFEKVMNTESVVEIKKAAENILIMRPIDEKSKTNVNIDQDNVKTIDLSHIYPTTSCSKERKECMYCKKLYVARDLKKHIEEVHLNLKKFSCNNCNRTFKRSYHYVKHICNKIRRINGVKSNRDSNIMIASVESLSIPLGL